jgi:hypothetical protein
VREDICMTIYDDLSRTFETRGYFLVADKQAKNRYTAAWVNPSTGEKFALTVAAASEPEVQKARDIEQSG